MGGGGIAECQISKGVVSGHKIWAFFFFLIVSFLSMEVTGPENLLNSYPAEHRFILLKHCNTDQLASNKNKCGS